MLAGVGRMAFLAARPHLYTREKHIPGMLLISARTFAVKRGKRRYIESVIVKQTKSTKRVVEVYQDMNVSELASVLSVSADELSESLLRIDKTAVDRILSDEPLGKDLLLKGVAMCNQKPKLVDRKKSKTNDNELDLLSQLPAPRTECETRPPIVTIMGHVDHGKTTLLDALRQSNTVQGEFGGITQHIGAFSVDLSGIGRRVTFLDTPGHAAFGAMRARGAKGADLVVLVVAADDGVKEQTQQSIRFVREAGVPMVVAVNKCDKPNADPARAKRSLLSENVVVEELGGDVQCVDISALHRKNLPALQEALLMQADLMDLHAPVNGLVEGLVIESSQVHGVGKTCTMVVTRGTLRKNSILVAGTTWCRVRTMTDARGQMISAAGPSTPVVVTGWKDEQPGPGDIVLETSSVDRAQKAVGVRKQKIMQRKSNADWESIEGQREDARRQYLTNRQQMLDRGIRFGSTLRRVVHKQQRLQKDKEDNQPRLRIIVSTLEIKFRVQLRSDVEGTLEAIMQMLDTYSSDQCKLQIVDFGVGDATEKDIEMAKETDALIYLFNVKASGSLKNSALKENVRIEQFNVIYRLAEALRDELSSRLPHKVEFELVGSGHVLKQFLISDRGRKRQPIAGVLVDWGSFQKNCVFKFIRDNDVYYEGAVESLKRENEVVAIVKTNTEVGIALEDKNVRFKDDDVVEVYARKDVPQMIDWHIPVL